MKTFYVYALFDAEGVVRYIGKGRSNRWTQHAFDKRYPKPFIREAIEKIGDFPRVKIREGLSEFEAFEIEQALITAIGMQPDGPLVNRTAKGSGPNSASVKAWHSNFTKEERSARMRAAIDASVSGRGRLSPEAKRAMIQPALNALTPEHHKEAAARLNDARARKSPEERSASAKKGRASMTSEQRSESARKAISSQSKEQLSETGRKRNAYISAETRSEIGRKRGAHLTPQQRSENAQHLIGAQTQEQLSVNGKKGAASITDEARSCAAKKRAQTLGPEKLREISMKAVAARLKKKELQTQS